MDLLPENEKSHIQLCIASSVYHFRDRKTFHVTKKKTPADTANQKVTIETDVIDTDVTLFSRVSMKSAVMKINFKDDAALVFS